jgi:hypothetical protein
VLEKPLSEIWSDMRKLEIFKQKTKNCMMLDPEFRRYIEKIPNGALLPYPFTKIFC